MFNKLFDDLLFIIIKDFNNNELKNFKLFNKYTYGLINNFKLKINIFNTKFEYIFKSKINNINNLNLIYKYLKYEKSLDHTNSFPLLSRKDLFILFYNIIFELK